MIAFDLSCSGGHKFEGWFSSSDDFAAQQAGGLLSCPVCDDIIVRKALSVPNVGRKGNQAAPIPATSAHTRAPVEQVSGEVVNAPSLPPAMMEIMYKLAVAQTEMLKESDWVGRDFAETARAIHYGEEADRLIHGETSADEAEALAEEGINIAPLPFPVIPPAAKN
jgi:hypothetical protein